MKKYFEVEKCTHHTTEILVNASENMSVEIVPVGCKMSHFILMHFEDYYKYLLGFLKYKSNFKLLRF